MALKTVIVGGGLVVLSCYALAVADSPLQRQALVVALQRLRSWKGSTVLAQMSRSMRPADIGKCTDLGGQNLSLPYTVYLQGIDIHWPAIMGYLWGHGCQGFNRHLITSDVLQLGRLPPR